MTNAKHPGDATDHASESGEQGPEALKQELFAAWSEAHPEGTRRQFDDAWTAMVTETRPRDTTDGPPESWDQDPVVLKRRMFEEWTARRPNGTHDQFEAEWAALTSVRDV